MNKDQRMRCTINRAREQGLDVSDKDLIETLFLQLLTEEDYTAEGREMVRTITNKRYHKHGGCRYEYDSKQNLNPKKEQQIDIDARSLEKILGKEDSVSGGEEDNDINNSNIHSEGEKDGGVENSGAVKKDKRGVVRKAWSHLCFSSHKPKRKKRKAKYVWQKNEKEGWRTNGNLYNG